MNFRLLVAMFCIGSLFTGCVVSDKSSPGDVSFLWTFAGLRCDQARDMYGVNITIPGQSLVNGGKFACSTEGVDGITLHDFAPRSYAYTLQAVDFQNRVLFEASGTFVINGSKTVQADLAPTGSPGSYAYLNWTFPGNASCAQANVATVDVLLDGSAPYSASCTDGQTSQGLRTPFLAPGLHSIELVARSPSGQPLYSFQGGPTTRAYDPVSATYSLAAVQVEPGDVTFLWTFGGLRCDQARDVYGVNITIPGEVLVNNGRYACNTAGVDGIVLHDFAPGSYSFTLQGVDFQNRIRFEASGTFVINGNRTVMVDLASVGSLPSYAYLNWTFPSNMSCAQAGVASVDITLDDLGSHNFACSQGQTSPGLQTPDLALGSHFIEFIARDASGLPLTDFNGELVTQANNPVSATYGLYVIGGASISWQFSDGSVTFDCNALDPTGNMQVGVNFQDTSTGEWVYGAMGDWHRCADKPIVYSYLRPGTYKLSLYAKTSTNVEYRSNPNIAPIQVQAQCFPGPGGALQVTMFRQ